MARPRTPNTANAVAAASARRVRGGQETKAATLRSAGWLVVAPEDVAAVIEALAAQPDYIHWLTGAVSAATRDNIRDLS